MYMIIMLDNLINGNRIDVGVWFCKRWTWL